MSHVSLREYGRLHRWSRAEEPPAGSLDARWLDARRYDRLRDHDLGRGEDRLFDWEHQRARARSWVGVLQIPGLVLELLPKIEGDQAGAEALTLARDNLMHMLDEAGHVPLKAREHAELSVSRGPLHEALIALFSRRLCAELLRGPDRGYVARTDDLAVLRGKLKLAEHLRRNAARRDRFTCDFEERSADTPLNRVLRATCRRLLSVARSEPARDGLGHALMVLDEVADLPDPEVWVDRVVLDRRNERFADLLVFCRMVLRALRPSGRAGDTETFSLLYDMNAVFEGFVTGFVSRRVMREFPGARLLPQAERRPTYLLQGSKGRVMRLKPDLLVERGAQRIVLDTKWKRLGARSQERKAGLSREDLYQLAAYARGFGSKRSVLLFPWTPDAEQRDFHLLAPGEKSDGARILLRFVRLDGRLGRQGDRDRLAESLRDVLAECLAEGA